MTHPLMYLIPIVVGVGAFIFFTITNQHVFLVEQEYEGNRRKRYQPEPNYDAPSNGTCTICLEPYDVAMQCQKVRCGHIFHRECYLRLLENSGLTPFCPNCKRPVF